MRGEPGRVAERVRALLDEHGRSLPEDEPAPAPRRSSGLRERWTWLGARLAARLPARVDPGRRGALAVGLAVLVAAVLTGAWVLAARPSAMPVSAPGAVTHGARSTASGASGSSRSGVSSASASGSAPGTAPTSAPAPAATASVVVVDVAGKVRHPGLYRLPAESRIDDAVRAAGGPLRGVRLDSLNLAAKLVDGQQIAVGITPAAGAGGAAPGGGGGGGGGEPAGSAASAPVNLNTATLDQLQTLPGVGPVLAQHVLDWRSAHGRFTSVDQLDDVTGIGPAKFGALKPLVTV